MERSDGRSRVLRLKRCRIAIPTTCVLWRMVHILHAADEARFGEPLPSGWEHSNFSYWVYIHTRWHCPLKWTSSTSRRSNMPPINSRIELIILVQEPCLNSTALLRYGQKSSLNFVELYHFYYTKIGRIFLLYLDD